MAFTTMKVLFIIGITSAGLGVNGAFIGFAIAAIAIAVWSRAQLPAVRGDKPMPLGFVTFACWMMLYTLAFNLSFKIDALMIRPALDTLLSTSGEVDKLMGEYGIAVSLSRLPWQSTIALTFVVFPMISEATFSEDKLRTKTYIQNTIRYALILICAVALPMCARPDYIFDCLALAMPGYGLGQAALVWLAPAYIFFSLSNLHNTIFMSSGRAKTALILMIINLTSVALALKLGLGSVTSESDLLSAAGRQICMAFAVVTVIGGLWLARVFEGYLSILSLARIIAAVGVAVFASQLTANGMSQVGMGETLGLKLTVLLSLPIYFFLVLWASGELNEEDRRRFTGVFRRRGGGGRREQDQ